MSDLDYHINSLLKVPSSKAPAIDLLLSKLTKKSREIQIASDKCMLCTEDATYFTDDLSRKEYTISGMCQVCQDKTFA
tara:strand:+ start:885 stop:1118 length:234 start_codon:yes stop_codon:yes gene_type:complete